MVFSYARLFRRLTLAPRDLHALWRETPMRPTFVLSIVVAIVASSVVMCGGDEGTSPSEVTPDGGGDAALTQGPDGAASDDGSSPSDATADAGQTGPRFSFLRTFPGTVQSVDVRETAPITALPGGGYAIAFTFTGTITVGTSTLVSTGARDVAIVIVDAQGNAVRGKMVAVNDDVEPRSLAADDQGNLYLSCLTFSASVDFGDGKSLSGSNVAQWGFIAKYDATGTTVWARSFASAGGLGQMLVAARGATLYAGGYSSLSGGIGYATAGGNVSSPTFMGNAEKGFVAALDPATGYVTWFEQMSCGGTGAKVWDVAVTSSGDVVTVGEFRGGPLSIDDPLVLGQNVGGSENIFVTKLTTAGAHAWTRTFGQLSARATGNVLATDSAGHVVASGVFNGGIDFGGGSRMGTAWVASFDAATGATSWDKGLPVGTPAGITLLGDGSAVVSFAQAQPPSATMIDGVALPTTNGGVLVGFGAGGAVTWARGKAPQGTGSPFARAGSLASDAIRVVEHGIFRGTVDFGAGAVTANGDGGATPTAYLLGLEP